MYLQLATSPIPNDTLHVNLWSSVSTCLLGPRDHRVILGFRSVLASTPFVAAICPWFALLSKWGVEQYSIVKVALCHRSVEEEDRMNLGSYLGNGHSHLEQEMFNSFWSFSALPLPFLPPVGLECELLGGAQINLQFIKYWIDFHQNYSVLLENDQQFQ